jgi:DhnA family fructose-bisphosphate aldolase class Ia
MQLYHVSSATAAGKERRFRRLFRADGRSVMVAMDHGGFQGYGPPLGDAAAPVAAGRPDGVLGNWYLARTAAGMFAEAGLVLRVDGGTTDLGGHSTGDRTGLLHRAEAALTIGADAVAVMAYPGSPDENVSLVRLAELCTECERLGLPVMAEVVPGSFAKAIPWSAENISRGARIAAELGADIIKTMCPPDPLEMAEVVASCPVPVVGLGGPKIESEDEIVELARAVTKSGAAGIIFGRNVWGSADPAGLLAKLHDAVHGDGEP